MVRAMPDVKSSRREKAARTRARIVESAHAEFLERGFHVEERYSLDRRLYLRDDC